MDQGPGRGRAPQTHERGGAVPATLRLPGESTGLRAGRLGDVVPAALRVPVPAAVGGSAPGSRPVPHLTTPAHVWYSRDVLAVARELLGSYLTRRSPEGDVTVRVTEVEAYGGADDPGSHAARGRTARNATMFAEPGRLYVYRHLGLHHCLNVVAQPAGRPAAVLLRAGEVVRGADLARHRREQVGVVDSDRQLARGPARLAVCLGLDLQANGLDVTEPEGQVVLQRPAVVGHAQHASGPRVGVSGAGGDAGRFPWRFWLQDERTVSSYRPAYRSPAPAGTPGGVTASA